MALTSEWIWSRLACPIDRLQVRHERDVLRCPDGHEFGIVDEIPLLNVADGAPQYPAFEEQKPDAASHTAPTAIDSFVQQNIVRTNGKLYRALRGRLKRYPIPELPLADGQGRSFLDVGSNWGRWTIAAARKGYRAVGIDVSLAAARAGRRVARQLGADIAFVVGDARRLPFVDGTFDACFSYSVLQHLDKKMARHAAAEMARVTRAGGKMLVQMPNRSGLLQALNRARQIVRRDHSPFRVRYWTRRELRSLFEDGAGPSQIRAEGFISLDAQAADLDMLPWWEASIVRFSEALRRATHYFPPLAMVADNLYVESDKPPAATNREESSSE
jgi:SAM-dependent methyltransferase